jgi:hypothetical protein
MPLNELPEALEPDRMLAVAWPTILRCINADPAGFKKETQRKDIEQALEHAISMLRPVFGSAERMIEALQSGAITFPDGIDPQHAFNFAGKWRRHEDSTSRIALKRRESAKELDAILVVSGHRIGQPRTQGEEAERRRNKKLNKKPSPWAQANKNE